MQPSGVRIASGARCHKGRQHSLWTTPDPEVVEEHLRVRLRPEPTSSRRRRLELSMQTLLAVEDDGERAPVDRDLQGVPRARCRLNAAYGVDDGALAANDAKEEQVVLESICTGPEVAAVRRDAPGKTGGLIDPA